ncbi:hypothetical protein ACP4OV_029640 [Aristida adscensionis]
MQEMEEEAKNNYRTRVRGSARGGGTAAERDLLLQWGNRKRLRCVKVQRRDVAAAATVAAEKAAASLRRAAAAAAAAGQHRSPRNSERGGNIGQSAQQQNNVIHMTVSPDRESPVKGGRNCNNGNLSASPEDKKGCSSGSEGSMWPNFTIALTNKEKEEDFLLFKGSRLPHRPKKRAKVIQKTVNLVCPGTWLCELTLERYEVREKKVSKKRPRGLKAMRSMDTDSE